MNVRLQRLFTPQPPSLSTWRRAHEFAYVLHGSIRLVSDWVKVSSGFITRPQRDVYDQEIQLIFTLERLQECCHQMEPFTRDLILRISSAGDFSVQDKNSAQSFQTLLK